MIRASVTLPVTLGKGTDVFHVPSGAACLPRALIILTFTHVAYLIISATRPGHYYSRFTDVKLTRGEVKQGAQGSTASELRLKRGSV